MTPIWMYGAIGFVLGLLFGSFLNVCITRLPRNESIVHPRSRCPQCGAPIRWYDNIPLLSWLLLRGRCRDCKRSIPLCYPLVELGVAVWFMTQASHIHRLFHPASGVGPLSAEGITSLLTTHIGVAILGFLLIGLMVMDWQTHILPDAFTLWGIVIGFLLACVQAAFLGPAEDQVLLPANHIHLTSPGATTDSGNVFLTGPEHLVLSRLTAICGAALLLLLIRWIYKALRHREGMGLGDVKLLAMIAAFLGFAPAIVALFFGVVIASVYAAFLLARSKANAASKLPFGSFLAIGGLLAALYANSLIDMYANLLR